jgi:hypothetical protein
MSADAALKERLAAAKSRVVELAMRNPVPNAGGKRGPAPKRPRGRPRKVASPETAVSDAVVSRVGA